VKVILELNILLIQIHAHNFLNLLKHRNSMLNTKCVLSSRLKCPFEVLLFPKNVLRSTARKASTLETLIM